MDFGKITSKRPESARLFPSCRLLIAITQFFATVVLYMNRVNISFAIVCINEDVSNGFNETDSNTTLIGSEDIIRWSRQTRGFILSSFFIGYLLTQIPAGWALQRVSAKWLLSGGMAITILCSFLSPVAAVNGWGVLVFLQILKGLACGCFYPCAFTIIANWAPADERSRIATFSLCGSAVGSIVGFLSAGFMCHWSFAGGWPSIFYIYALVACIWLVAWVSLVYDNPSNHPFISERERLYVTKATEKHLRCSSDTKGVVPWRKLLSSPPVYAVWTVDFTYHWLWYTILTLLPTFIHDIFHLDIRKNGVYSCLPYLANLLLAWIGSWIADYMVQRRMTITRIRKIMVALSTLIPAALVITLVHQNSSAHIGVVSSLTVGVGFLGFARSGNLINRIDLAPKYVGIVQGISNTLATLAGIIAPLVTSAMVPDGTRTQWRHALYLGAGLSLIGAVTFIVFGSGEVQPWAMPNQEKSQNSDNSSEVIPL